MNASNLTGGAILGSGMAAGDQLYLFDVSASGAARTKSLTVKESRRGLSQDGYNAQTWTSGNIAITPADFVGCHLEVVTVTGTAGSRTATIADGDSTTRFAGNRASVHLVLPATASIVISLRNTAGDTLDSITTDGVHTAATIEVFHNGTKWVHLRTTEA